MLPINNLPILPASNELPGFCQYGREGFSKEVILRGECARQTAEIPARSGLFEHDLVNCELYTAVFGQVPSLFGERND